MSNLMNAMKEVYLEVLRHSVVDLSFEKKDGTIRVMKATLDMDKIPEDKRPKGVRPAQPESSIMRVFDLDLNEFRSVDAAKLLTFGGVLAASFAHAGAMTLGLNKTKLQE